MISACPVFCRGCVFFSLCCVSPSFDVFSCFLFCVADTISLSHFSFPLHAHSQCPPPPPTQAKPSASSFRAVGFGRPGKGKGISVHPGVPSLAAAAAAAAAASTSSFCENSDQAEVLSLRQANVVRVLGPPVEWRSKKRTVRVSELFPFARTSPSSRAAVCVLLSLFLLTSMLHQRWQRSVQRPPAEELLRAFVETEKVLQSMQEDAQREGVSDFDVTGRAVRKSSLTLQRRDESPPSE